MADFVDSEAEESENENSEEEVKLRSVMPKKTKRKLHLESEDEEDDDGEEVVDLIDDNPIEEDDSENESDGSRKRKKSDDENDDDSDDRLDEEDYDLLEDNLGVKVQRKKFKRLKRIQEEDSDEEETQDRGDDREVIANQLFEGSDHEDERLPVERSEITENYASEESEGEYSDTDGFIVDDEGRSITEKRRKRKPIFADTTLQEAQDIFGVDFDYDEFEKYDDEYYEEDEEEDEYEDEEQRNIRKAKKPTRKKRKPKTIYEIYEPSELERAGFTDEDNRIRNQDIPERMQLRTIPVVPASDEELDEEAEWIYDIAFGNTDSTSNKQQDKTKVADSNSAAQPKPNIGGWDEDWDDAPTAPAATVAVAPQKPSQGQDENWDEDWDAPAAPRIITPPPAEPNNDWDDSENLDTAPKTTRLDNSAIASDDVKAKTIPKIRKALEFMRNQHLEVPFIAFYRKEYVEPELSMNDLWTIYRLDSRYCQLRIRKTRLSVLFQNMKDYQTDYIMSHPDEPIPESTRLISDDDLERIKSIRNQEELKDMYLQFTLYYTRDVQVMKENLLRKKKEKLSKARDASVGQEEGGEDGVETQKEFEEGKALEYEGGAIRRKIGGGPYALCCKLGMDAFAKKFGLSAAMFAQNLRDNYQRHEVDQYPMEPLEAAKDFISTRLSSAEEVLKAGKFMVSTQISREPLVRHSVREVFFERATISVTPTKKGLKEIDESHPAYGMRYIKEKPVRDLITDQFLILTMAEDDKLIVIRIGENIKGVTSPNYLDEVKQLYYKDGFSKIVQDWNQLRNDCVEFALEKLLYPVLRKELRAKLLEKCRDHVLKACSQKLYHWIKVAPYQVSFPEEDDEDWDTSKGIKVLAIAYVPDLSQASFACLINHDGEPSDYLRLQNITKHKNKYRESDREEKETDLLALKNFIRQKKPHLIVIGAESRESIMIQDDLRSVVLELVSEDGFPHINIEVYDNQEAKVYANSIKATNDFREYPLILRQAISLGRRIQDPLVEFSQLCNADEEILCLRFHPLQDQVSKEELLEYLQLEFINQTNEVGVDVNRSISCPYTSNLVQFVCGLGPRKALALIKTLKQNNQRLENRTQLITVCHMGPKIFINCSGFIKIDTNSLGDSTEAYVEVLDGSRVHPETYEWARKMAVDALEYDDEDANPAGALEEILEAPERLRDLDLDAFAEELERQGFGNKSITLYDIRGELNHRYKDLRTAFKMPNSEELFNMLTKETPETLYIGKLITANVAGISHKKPQGEQLDNAIPVRNEETGMWQCAFCMKNDFPDLSEVWNHFDAGACPGQATGVRIRLDNGISGFIPIAKLSDKQVTNPESRVKRGQSIHCRVVKIDVERFSVECTSRTSDLSDINNEWRQSKDPYYDQEMEEKELKKEDDLKKMKQRQTYIKRVIVHPSFKNISFKESEKLMGQMDQGEVIIRPSSKGADHLTLTWKVADSVYQHTDVREEGKENAFSLGQSLWIGNEEFEDLDEIIARHVNPMAAYARDLMNFKYYKGMSSRQAAEEYILEERRKTENKIHYLLFASKEYPGKFVLSYLPKLKVHHEYISITPEGFRFRQQNFDTMSQMFKWFKEHYRDPPPSSTPLGTPRVPPVRTPFITPAYNDASSRVGAPPSQFGGMSQAPTHATPHYATPAQNFTPFAAFNSHTPYTPTAQTPYMTPYQTPFQGTATPRFSSQQSNVGTSTFIHPGATTPSYKLPQQRIPQQRLPPSNIAKSNVNTTTESSTLDWRKAAEAWAKSQQKGRPQNWTAPSKDSGGSSSPYTPSSFSTTTTERERRDQPTTRNAAQVINEGIQKTKQMSSAHNFIAHNKSPKSGRESLRSTPRTNFSPRSMVESSLGDETPLYDEN